MKTQQHTSLSRRSFLKGTGLGLGALATSAPTFAWQNTIDVHQGVVATATLKNAGLQEQDQLHAQYMTLTDTLDLAIRADQQVLIVLGVVTNKPFPYSVDSKLLYASLKHLLAQGVSAQQITIAYHTEQDLPPTAPLMASASKALGVDLAPARFINTRYTSQWETLALPNALPNVRVLASAKRADHLVYLGQLTDQHGQPVAPERAIAHTLLAADDLVHYAEQLDALTKIAVLNQAVFAKVRLLANNTTRFISATKTASTEEKCVHPGILNISNDMTSQAIFARHYLSALQDEAGVSARHAQSLVWMQHGSSRDPLTTRLVESALSRSGVALKKVTLG
ncbi:twin-arginine translocation signal domain-containing protein [Pseudoalteromonas viridis]|uniref:Twin-arginine translocation signal domain-containing protein n=1 Tax=Pseudoalteromonas viridis TaxID=339617 RepID=A0ABX7V8Z6_9GAMM|nr:twin-arginine translocation signal domain-containing protein [Pseudoalteromonas viridis]QTL36970.1 twin-arginine translocation signal domain-containing protein [Pseudoalteromonas viridis]